MNQSPNGVVGYGAGAPASGVTFLATSSPFDVISPAVWEGFKKAVKAAADNWGLQVSISEHPSITDAKTRFWQAQRVVDAGRKAGE